jgi:hypothetical protein
MSQAIIRVAKIKTAGAARGKTAHNYRLMETPNADPDRTKALNQEYLNTDRADYWRLAEQRIGEVVTRKVRDDQVRAVEVVLTASPEWFRRGADGQAEDMRESKWVADNLHFLKEKFGERNVVSFTLHQDEKTPHVHAVVIPITDKNRLSADTLFNPKTLSQLQTDYAAAMAEHGLERGVAGSRRQHQDMKQVYGHQAHTAAELAPLVQPVAVQAFSLPDVPLLGREAWKAQQEAAINAEIARQVGDTNQRLEKVGNVAVAHAGGTERADVLARQLGVSEGLKQGHFTQLQANAATNDLLAMQLALGQPPAELVAKGQKLIESYRQETEATLLKTAQTGHYTTASEYLKLVQHQGYQLQRGETGKTSGVIHPTGVAFQLAQLHPGGLSVQKLIEQTLAAREREVQERAVQVERARVGRELATMEKAFLGYRWRIDPTDLKACLLVPDELTSRVETALRAPGSYAAALHVEGEPHRRDGKTAVYAKYGPERAHDVSALFEKLRQAGVEVHEHAGDQARREQLRAQPQVVRSPAQEQEAEQAREHKSQSRGRGMGIGGR